MAGEVQLHGRISFVASSKQLQNHKVSFADLQQLLALKNKIEYMFLLYMQEYLLVLILLVLIASV